MKKNAGVSPAPFGGAGDAENGDRFAASTLQPLFQGALSGRIETAVNNKYCEFFFIALRLERSCRKSA